MVQLGYENAVLTLPVNMPPLVCDEKGELWAKLHGNLPFLLVLQWHNKQHVHGRVEATTRGLVASEAAFGVTLG